VEAGRTPAMSGGAFFLENPPEKEGISRNTLKNNHLRPFPAAPWVDFSGEIR